MHSQFATRSRSIFNSQCNFKHPNDQIKCNSSNIQQPLCRFSIHYEFFRRKDPPRAITLDVPNISYINSPRAFPSEYVHNVASAWLQLQLKKKKKKIGEEIPVSPPYDADENSSGREIANEVARLFPHLDERIAGQLGQQAARWTKENRQNEIRTWVRFCDPRSSVCVCVCVCVFVCESRFRKEKKMNWKRYARHPSSFSNERRLSIVRISSRGGREISSHRAKSRMFRIDD